LTWEDSVEPILVMGDEYLKPSLLKSLSIVASLPDVESEAGSGREVVVAVATRGDRPRSAWCED